MGADLPRQYPCDGISTPPKGKRAAPKDRPGLSLVGRLRTSGLRRAAVSSERDGCYRTGCSAWRTHDDGDGRSYTGQ